MCGALIAPKSQNYALLQYRKLQYAPITSIWRRSMKLSPIYIAMVTLAISTSGCASNSISSKPTFEEELMSADKAYEAHNLKFGFKDASTKFIDFKTGFMLNAEKGFLNGETQILEDRNLTTVPSPVHWQALGAMAASSGDLGITWGNFSVDGNPETNGNYVTVWKKISDEWKIVTDIAVDDVK